MSLGTGSDFMLNVLEYHTYIELIEVRMNKEKVALREAGKRLLEEVVEEDLTKV